jgi:hypothetical protein
MRVTRDDDTATIHIALASASAEALGAALDELTDAVSDLRGVLDFEGHRSARYGCEARFEGPGGCDERTFFERCVAVAALHPRVIGYVEQLATSGQGIDFAYVDGLCHHDARFPAGSYAIVPLALESPRYIATLIEHMRTLDLNHESFHPCLIDRLLTVHGLCDETMELLVFRAGDGDGGVTGHNLRIAVTAHGLREHWGRWGGLTGFAARLREVSESLEGDTDDKAALRYHLVNVGVALCTGVRSLFDQWLDRCEELWSVELDRDEAARAFERPIASRTHAYTDAEWHAEWRA